MEEEVEKKVAKQLEIAHTSTDTTPKTWHGMACHAMDITQYKQQYANKQNENSSAHQKQFVQHTLLAITNASHTQSQNVVNSIRQKPKLKLSEA